MIVSVYPYVVKRIVNDIGGIVNISTLYFGSLDYTDISGGVNSEMVPKGVSQHVDVSGAINISSKYRSSTTFIAL